MTSKKSNDANYGYENLNNTPLHVAASQGDIKKLMLLLKDGQGLDDTNINKKNKSGDTPLAVAATCGNEEAIKILLEHGANMRLKNKAGDTPYDIAHLYGNNTRIENIFSQYKKLQKGQVRVLKPKNDSGAQLNDVVLGASKVGQGGNQNPLKVNVGTVNILALNGGGIRGYYSIWILKNIIDRIRNRSKDGKFSERKFLRKFSIIAGTSTGSITAAFIVVELRKKNNDLDYIKHDLSGTPILDKAIEIYDNDKEDIFYTPYPKFVRIALNQPLYSTEKFEKRLKEILVEETKDKTGTTTTIPAAFRTYKHFSKENMPFLHISSYNLNTTQVAEFTDRLESLDYSAFDSHSDAKIWEAVLASSAAPIYFPSRKIPVKKHRDSHGFEHKGGMHEFCDGGVYANNPGLAALGYARMLNEFEDDQKEYQYSQYSVLNIGTMFSKPEIDLDKTWFGGGGPYTWMNPSKDLPLLNIVMQANTNFIRNTLKRLNTTSSLREENEDDFAYFEIDNYNIKESKLDSYDADTMKALKDGAMRRFADIEDNKWFLDKLDEWIERYILWDG